MAATRGPQVVLEGYARTVARGGGGKTMRDNIAAMDQLVVAGLVADGNAVDGSSRTGGKPYDAVVAQFPHEPVSAWEVPAPLLDLSMEGAPFLSLSGGTMAGPITLWGDATDPLHATPLRQVVPVAGGTMTGPLMLAGDATLALQAVPFRQVNSKSVGGPFLPTAGGLLTGPLALGTALGVPPSSIPGGATPGDLNAVRLFQNGVPVVNTSFGYVLRGNWNAATNTPALVSSVGTQGDVWLVTVAGSTDLNGNTTWVIGDQAIFVSGVWSRVATSSAYGSMAVQNADSVAIDGGRVIASHVQALVTLQGPNDRTSGNFAWGITDPGGDTVGVTYDGYVHASGIMYYEAQIRGRGANGRIGLLTDLANVDVLSVEWPSGVFGAAGLRDYGDTTPRNVGAYVWDIEDGGHHVSIGVYPQGDAYGAFRTIDATATTPIARSSGTPVWEHTDKGGKRAISVLADGAIDLRMSDSAVLNTAIRSYVPPATMRGTANVFNLRRAPGMLVGTLQDSEGFVYDVGQTIDGPETTLIAIGRGPISGILWYGQSNTAGDTVGLPGTLLTTQRFPNQCIQLNGQATTYGNARGTTWNRYGFAPLLPPNPATNNIFPMMPQAHAQERWSRDRGNAGGTNLFWCNWYGDQPIETFVKGTDTYNNQLDTVAALRRIVARYPGQTGLVSAVMFSQGENYSPGWLATFTQLCTDLRTDVTATMGQAAPPLIFLQQINTPSGSNSANSFQTALDQLTAGTTLTGVVMVGPSYHFPMDSSTIHSAPLGRCMQGENMALAYETMVTLGLPYTALKPNNAVLSGNIIIVTFDVPTDVVVNEDGVLVTNPLAIAWDTDWTSTSSVIHHGFGYSDSGGTIGVLSVAITAPGTLQVTLSGDPVSNSNRVLTYAGAGNQSNMAWGGGVGDLMVQTTRESAAYRIDPTVYAIPRYVRHYCVRFRWSV